MKKAKNPAMGGSYIITREGERILMDATDRKPTESEKKALEAVLKPKAKPTEKGDE